MKSPSEHGKQIFLGKTEVLRGDVWIKGNFVLVFSLWVKKNLSSMKDRTIFDNIDVLCLVLETWKVLRKSSACGIRLMPQRCSPDPPILSFFPLCLLAI